MKESVYKSYDELPLFLNAELVGKVLGVSSTTAYELMHNEDFPSLRIGNRLIVAKEKFREWVMRLKYRQYPKRNAIKNYFPLPNEIFCLALSAGEIAVYAYLMYCEDRKSFQCHPSYKTIGRAVGLSRNTVKKYVSTLEEKRLIFTKSTTVCPKDGRKRNGSLLYTIRPIEEAKEYYYQLQLERAALMQAQSKAG